MATSKHSLCEPLIGECEAESGVSNGESGNEEYDSRENCFFILKAREFLCSVELSLGNGQWSTGLPMDGGVFG